MEETTNGTDTTKGTKERFNLNKWVKSFGLGAFMFFLIKGLIWLAVFFGLFKFVGC